MVCLDDILITGHIEEKNLQKLQEVLERLEKHGLRLKQDKCQFLGMR